MRRKVIFDGINFEITSRELLFSIIIVLVLTTIGLFISEKISSEADEANQEYEQATKIDNNQDLFEYGMRTNIGNAFVYGTLKAVDPISLPELEGKYTYIKKVKERYTKHIRTVTHTDGKRTWTTEETYYTWDRVGSEEFNCKEVSFLGNIFPYGIIRLPVENNIETIRESYSIRYVYSVSYEEYVGTIYTRLYDNTISKATLYTKDINGTINYLRTSGVVNQVAFWILWVILTAGSVYGFYYLDNRWIED